MEARHAIEVDQGCNCRSQLSGTSAPVVGVAASRNGLVEAGPISPWAVHYPGLPWLQGNGTNDPSFIVGRRRSVNCNVDMDHLRYFHSTARPPVVSRDGFGHD